MSREKKPELTHRQWAVLAVAAVVVVVAITIWSLYLRPSLPPVEVASKQIPSLELPDRPSIAVLPFVNMSGDPEQEYFSDGMTEEIITALSKVPRLFVIARNSSFFYKGKSVKVQEVGRELGVQYVLEGSVRKAGDRVRITAQLIEATKGNHLWAERYDQDLKDVFALQDEITMKILTALQVKLTEGEQARVLGKGTENHEAYVKIFQRREHIYRMNEEGMALARQSCEEAIAELKTVLHRNPDYSGAWLNLTAIYSSLGREEEARGAAAEVLRLDPKFSLEHFAKTLTYKNKAESERLIEALRKAGLE